MSKIGIMGGTFNPIHIGHIEIAKAAYEQYHLDEIWFMPNHIPAYKSEDSIVSGEERMAMVKLAIEAISYCKASDFELKREGNTYTIDTLKLLCQQYPENDFYFIMGADSLFCFDKWKNYREIPNYAMLLVAPRDEKSKVEVLQEIEEYNKCFGKTCFQVISCKEIPCSSSEIRLKLSERKYEVDGSKLTCAKVSFLPEKVFRYIVERKLYI